MPEYLTPAVYVEETSFRARSIEGVATSTVGMVGLTRYGPVSHVLTTAPLTPPPAPPLGTTPTPAYETRYVVAPPPLITSYGEFERAFGGLGQVMDDTNYTAFAARAFFANGGRRLYVARTFPWPTAEDGSPDPAGVDASFATRPVRPPAPAPATGALPVPGAAAAPPAPLAQWRARWPGAAGREIRVDVRLRRGKNIVVPAPGGRARLGAVRANALVELLPPGAAEPAAGTPPDPATVHLVREVAGVKTLVDGSGATVSIDPTGPAANQQRSAYQLQVDVTVTWGNRSDAYPELALHPDNPRSVLNVLALEDPPDAMGLVWLRTAAPVGTLADAVALLSALIEPGSQGFLDTGGVEAAQPRPGDLAGAEASPDNVRVGATGLNALAGIDDIAIVIAPDTVRFTDADANRTAVDLLIGHAERARYRIAVVDPPRESSLSEVRAFRVQFESSYAALYYPWVEIVDPTVVPEPGAATPKLLLPPSGYVAGIYARSDIERGVYKAPANEVIRGITRFETTVTGDRQAVLNPEGINALRFFSGRANRVWGARTLSSDPEWKYVNVRRLFIFLEHSIEKSTGWAVFEPNNERLWASIRRSVEDFLFTQWQSGALLGSRPEEAYFVRCDRTTMSQNDLDNGRMICLVGVAPTYPAEFVIFRIGQWTADSQQA